MGDKLKHWLSPDSDGVNSARDPTSWFTHRNSLDLQYKQLPNFSRYVSMTTELCPSVDEDTDKRPQN